MSIEIIVYAANVKVGKGTNTRETFMLCDSRFPSGQPKQIDSIEGVVGYCSKVAYDVLIVETDYEKFKMFWDTYGQNY